MAGFELFTDGACSGNPGPGGWAFVLRGPGVVGDMERSGGEAQTTNNRMELMAVIEGLQTLAEPSEVRVVSDSEYVVKGLREWLDGWKARGWRTAAKKPVKNDDLWKRLDALRAMHRVRPEWIRGHNEHPENTRCDALAVAAIEAVRRGGGVRTG
ncbi:MAG: ribonuclease HI [Planctomycetes bacterium]|jgi:ribonuclease HI|nr:ribonuclease HI [Planctomycetota bacterium]